MGENPCGFLNKNIKAETRVRLFECNNCKRRIVLLNSKLSFSPDVLGKKKSSCLNFIPLQNKLTGEVKYESYFDAC